ARRDPGLRRQVAAGDLRRPRGQPAHAPPESVGQQNGPRPSGPDQRAAQPHREERFAPRPSRRRPGLRGQPDLIELYKLIEIGPGFIEKRLEMSEVIAGSALFSFSDESLEAPVIFVAVASDRLDDPGLARLCDIPRRLLEGLVEPGAMLLELRHRAIA